MLTAAVALKNRKRGRRSISPSLIILGALMAYVWLVFHSSLYVLVVWRFPESVPHTFFGVESLGKTLSVSNALWALLIIAKLVEVSSESLTLRKGRLVPLLMALLVVALLQKFAFLITGIAHWEAAI